MLFRSIADSSGRILLVNPTPGGIGNLALRVLEGPGIVRLSANLIKRIQFAEGKNLELRVDAASLPNKPIFGSPNTDINSPSFGRITFAEGNRIIAVGMRLNF